LIALNKKKTPHQCAVPASTSYKIDGLVSVDRGDDRALMQAIDELGLFAFIFFFHERSISLLK